jgi:hypothetical protein
MILVMKNFDPVHEVTIAHLFAIIMQKISVYAHEVLQIQLCHSRSEKTAARIVLSLAQ